MEFDLEPGERWLEAIEHAIDDSDLFVLFWSHDAEQSTWVRREVQHALQHQGLDEEELPEIWPVILDGPPPATPWQELSHLHFDDPIPGTEHGEVEYGLRRAEWRSP